MPQRNQRKKSLEGSGKCKANARDMLHWPNCGFLLPPPSSTITSPGTQHNSANDVICGSPEVSPCLRCTQLYHSGKQKRKAHPFIQRSISKVAQIPPAERSPACRPSPFIPPIIVSKQEAVTHPMDSISSAFLTSTNELLQEQSKHNEHRFSTQHPVPLFRCQTHSHIHYSVITEGIFFYPNQSFGSITGRFRVL